MGLACQRDTLEHSVSLVYFFQLLFRYAFLPDPSICRSAHQKYVVCDYRSRHVDFDGIRDHLRWHDEKLNIQQTGFFAPHEKLVIGIFKSKRVK